MEKESENSNQVELEFLRSLVKEKDKEISRLRQTLVEKGKTHYEALTDLMLLYRTAKKESADKVKALIDFLNDKWIRE